MAALRVLDEIQISPWLPSQPPQALSFLDIMWLQSSQIVERIFFYDFPDPISYFIDHNLPIFTKSLSLTLRHFYLLAGSIRPSPDSEDQFEIVYTEGDSVTITVAECTGDDFRNISSHHPRNFNNLRLLVPKPAKSSAGGQFPLISIQITLFPNQGLCIGLAMNHAACDVSGSMRFIRSWAAACRSTEPTLDGISPRFLDRSYYYRYPWNTPENIRCDASVQRCIRRILKQTGHLPCFRSYVGKDQIERLKGRVQAEGVEEGKPLFHISSFVVACAYVWRCLVKALGHDGDIKQYFVCVVEWRSRLRPPIQSNHFGNCLGICMAELKAGELVGKDGIEVAAMEIGKNIDGLQGKDVGEVLTAAIDGYVELARSKPLSVADFGWLGEAGESGDYIYSSDGSHIAG